MKLYFLYVITAILNFYAIMFLWGVAAGFASYLPVVSVISSILLFTIATPIIVVSSKWGVILGLVFSLTMMPNSVIYIFGTIGDSNYHDPISLLFNIPYILPFVIIGCNGKVLIKKDYHLIRLPSALVSKVLLSVLPVALTLFIFWAIYLSPDSEHGRIRKGNAIVMRIENYKLNNGRYPDSLGDIGMHSNRDWDAYGEGANAIYYEKKDTGHYIVYFGTTLGESKIYYSDSKKWEDLNRPMK